MLYSTVLHYIKLVHHRHHHQQQRHQQLHRHHQRSAPVLTPSWKCSESEHVEALSDTKPCDGAPTGRQLQVSLQGFGSEADVSPTSASLQSPSPNTTKSENCNPKP